MRAHEFFNVTEEEFAEWEKEKTPFSREFASKVLGVTPGFLVSSGTTGYGAAHELIKPRYDKIKEQVDEGKEYNKAIKILRKAYLAMQRRRCEDRIRAHEFFGVSATKFMQWERTSFSSSEAMKILKISIASREEGYDNGFISRLQRKIKEKIFDGNEKERALIILDRAVNIITCEMDEILAKEEHNLKQKLEQKRTSDNSSSTSATSSSSSPFAAFASFNSFATFASFATFGCLSSSSSRTGSGSALPLPTLTAATSSSAVSSSSPDSNTRASTKNQSDLSSSSSSSASSSGFEVATSVSSTFSPKPS